MATVDQMFESAKMNGAEREIDTRMRVGDAWVTPAERETAPVINPATGAADLIPAHA